MRRREGRAVICALFALEDSEPLIHDTHSEQYSFEWEKGIMPWQVLSSEIVYQDVWFNVRKDTCRLPDAKVIDFLCSERRSGSIIFPLTATQEVLFLQQYRHAAGARFLELSGGATHATNATNSISCLEAQQTLSQETGYGAGRWSALHRMHTSPSRSSRAVFPFLVQDAIQIQTPHFTNTFNEDAQVLSIPLEEIPDRIACSDICAMSTVAACMRVFQRLGYLDAFIVQHASHAPAPGVYRLYN